MSKIEQNTKLQLIIKVKFGQKYYLHVRIGVNLVYIFWQ